MSLTETKLQPLLTKLNQTSELTLGFIGMGLMGIPMAQRLLGAGFEVNVWNRDQSKLNDERITDAHHAQSVEELVGKSDIVMICVTDTDAVEAIVFGDGGIAESLKPEQLLIDFSSIAPDRTRQFAHQLQQNCGATWIDAPVSGGVAGAEAGTLAIMAGGPAAVVDALQPVLAPLSQRLTRMGETGSGQATKVCNQMLVSCNIAVMAEVLAMAEKAGVDSSLIPQALQGGFADSIPLQLTGTRMANRELEEIKWHVKTLLKDLYMAENLAGQCHANTPMADLAKTILQTHGDNGHLEHDPATLITHYTHT